MKRLQEVMVRGEWGKLEGVWPGQGSRERQVMNGDLGVAGDHLPPELAQAGRGGEEQEKRSLGLPPRFALPAPLTPVIS